MSVKDPLTLWCLVITDPFPINVGRRTVIANLKEAIKGKRDDLLHGVDASKLVLWKLNDTEPVKPGDTVLQRIRKRGKLDATKLDTTDEIAAFFPQNPLASHIHILVVPSTCERGSRKAPTPHSPSANTVLRAQTVSGLYQKLKKYRFVQVRGTPGSGKTSLAGLLCHYIRQQEPVTNIIWIQGWQRTEINAKGGWQYYLETEKGWVKGDNTVFVFDEGQLSYCDGDLWNNFFKTIEEDVDPSDPDDGNIRAIIFASYGSPSTRFAIESTPIVLDDAQRVTLRSIQHPDNLPPIGLFFSRAEFGDLVSKQYPFSRFHASFLDRVFDLTQGHIGAVKDFIKVVLAHSSYREMRNTSQSYTWDMLLSEIGPYMLLERLESSASIFRRGLPAAEELQERSVACIFETVLYSGIITDGNLTCDDERAALQLCFHNGWLHADKLAGRIGYCFPSPLHHWYMEWKLWGDASTAIPIPATNILDFVVAVIRMFSPECLATRRIGPGFIQHLPEAQYQDEFYRCCHSYSKGCLVTLPEYGTRRGRIDFYIPSKQWGVELLRNGNMLEEHANCLLSTGSYGRMLGLADYIILDCRNKRPVKPHPHLPKLYHVVFSDDFHTVSILDNKLNSVSGGEFVLSHQ